MTRFVLPGAWYTDVTLSGEWAALYKNTKIATSRGDVPLPPRMDNLVHLRCADRGALYIAGQGQRNDGQGDGQAWLWNGEKWLILTPFTNGQKVVAFGPKGVYVAQPDNICSVYALTGEFLYSFSCPLGSGGIQYVTDAGEVVTGDSTYQSEHLAEWTQLGDVRIGGGYQGGALVLSDGELRELEPGGCYFIHGYRDGTSLAASTVKQDEDRAVLFWFDVSEIDNLPITQDDVIVTQPPETPEPEVPESLLPTLQREYAALTRPITEAKIGALLNTVAWQHRADGWGLSRKTTGHHIESPAGPIASDILHHKPSDTLWDCLTDEGPTWFQATHHNNPDRPWVAPVNPGSDPEDPEDPEQPDGSLDALVGALIAAATAPLYLELAAQQARIQALESQAPPEVPAFPSRIALKSAHGKWGSVQEDGSVIFDRNNAGPWETLEVKVQE